MVIYIYIYIYFPEMLGNDQGMTFRQVLGKECFVMNGIWTFLKAQNYQVVVMAEVQQMMGMDVFKTGIDVHVTQVEGGNEKRKVFRELFLQDVVDLLQEQVDRTAGFEQVFGGFAFTLGGHFYLQRQLFWIVIIYFNALYITNYAIFFMEFCILSVYSELFVINVYF